MRGEGEVARLLRRRETGAEAVLWGAIRNRQIGPKFLRQYSIGYEYQETERFFVADFYSSELKLVIEVDGPIHEKQRAEDQLRSEIIASQGIKIIRFTNRDIKKDLPQVLATIKQSYLAPSFREERGGPSIFPDGTIEVGVSDSCVGESSPFALHLTLQIQKNNTIKKIDTP